MVTIEILHIILVNGIYDLRFGILFHYLFVFVVPPTSHSLKP